MRCSIHPAGFEEQNVTFTQVYSPSVLLELQAVCADPWNQAIWNVPFLVGMAKLAELIFVHFRALFLECNWILIFLSMYLILAAYMKLCDQEPQWAECQYYSWNELKHKGRQAHNSFPVSRSKIIPSSLSHTVAFQNCPIWTVDQ